MSKKKSNNSTKHNKNKKNNTMKNSNSINKKEELNLKNTASDDNKINIEEEKIDTIDNTINNFDSSDNVLNTDDLFIEIGNNDESIYDEGIDEYKDGASKQENKEENKEDKNKEENIDYIYENDIEVEKQASSTALRVIEKKSFFLLIFKFLGVCIKNFFSSIYGVLYTCYLKINNFFEDRAEELDRKIREIKDEQVIKEKKRELDYERYNSKRIYEDLERAEKYRNRASNRVNTEKYFEDKINEEKINNKILVKKAEEEAREAKESKEKERSINQFNESKRKSRIEKKKNEILELRRRRKEKEKLLKEEEKRKQEEKELRDSNLHNKEELDKINKNEKIEINKNTDINGKRDKKEIKESSKELRKNYNENNENQNNVYDDLFKEFGNEEYFDEDDIDTSDIPNVDDIVKKADKDEKIQNVNYKEKNKDRINEPYEKFEKENDVREIDDKLKSEILRLIDVPESETKEDFISEIDIPASFRKEEIENENENLNNIDKNEHKSYADELMEKHSNSSLTIGDLLGDNEEQKEDINENQTIDSKEIDSNKVKNPKSKVVNSKESDPTVNIFAALRDANRKNKEKEENKIESIANTNKDRNFNNVNNSSNDDIDSSYSNSDYPRNSRVRVSKNQDGFKNLKLKNHNNVNKNINDEDTLNVGTWERKENIEENNVLKKNKNKDKSKDKEEFVEEYLNYKNPYEAYGKYIKNPEPEKKIENVNKSIKNKNDIEIKINNDLINKAKSRNNNDLNNNLNDSDKKNSNLNDGDFNNQEDKKNIKDVKGKFVNLFKSQKEKDKKESNDFDEDLYTNKFIKNIIGVDDNQNSPENRRRAEIRRESRERRENRNSELQNEEKSFRDDYSNNGLTEQEEKERYIREYLNDTSYLDGNLKLDKERDDIEDNYNHFKEPEDPKVKILNVEEINKDEIVVNAYVDSDEMVYNPNENNYEYDYKETERNESSNHRGEHHFNLKDSTRKKVEERRERKISKNEEIQRRANDEFSDDKMSFGDVLKDMMSGINSSLSEIPENWKKKRESRNRIKRNQIYSTSHNRRRGRR